LNKNSQIKSSTELNKNTNSEGVHDPVHHSAFCPELQQIIDHWDSLSEHIKAAIKALIQSHNKEIK
jgi:hypothetical protein